MEVGFGVLLPTVGGGDVDGFDGGDVVGVFCWVRVLEGERFGGGVDAHDARDRVFAVVTQAAAYGAVLAPFDHDDGDVFFVWGLVGQGNFDAFVGDDFHRNPSAGLAVPLGMIVFGVRRVCGGDPLVGVGILGEFVEPRLANVQAALDGALDMATQGRACCLQPVYVEGVGIVQGAERRHENFLGGCILGTQVQTLEGVVAVDDAVLR